MKNDLELPLLSGHDDKVNTGNVFDKFFANKDNLIKSDYHGLEDKIDVKFGFYYTQLNHLYELEGMDLAKEKDIDFSDLLAIQHHLQKEGEKDQYQKFLKQNKTNRNLLLPAYVMDKQIAPEILGKQIRKDIVENQSLMPEDIIYKHKARKTLEELFLHCKDMAFGYEQFLDNKEMENNPTRIIPEQELDFLPHQTDKIESLHVEYLQRNQKMFALIRYVLRNKKDNSLKTVMKIFNFTKPFFRDEMGQPDQKISHSHNMNARASAKASLRKSFSFSTPRNSVKSNTSKVDLEAAITKEDEKISNFPEESGLNDCILTVETVIHDTSELEQTFSMAHNQMTLKYGQWVFYYVVNKKAEEESIKLMMFNLDKPKNEAILVDEQVFTKKNMSVYAPILKVEAGAKEDPAAAPPSEYETLEVFGTVGIHFNVCSQFIGDSSCNLEVEEGDAQEWIKKQYVVHLGKSKRGEAPLCVSSIRRCQEIGKYFVAVSQDFVLTGNEATLGQHEEILREGEENDYFTLKVNSTDFVFASEDTGHEHCMYEKEDEKFEDRAAQTRALKNKAVFHKQVFSQFVGNEDIDVEELMKQPSLKEIKCSDISDVKNRRKTIADLGEEFKKSKALPIEEEAPAANEGTSPAAAEGEAPAAAVVDPNAFELDDHVKCQRILFVDEMDECFIKLIAKVQSSIYSLYQIRSNHKRNYVYKSQGDKYKVLEKALTDLQPNTHKEDSKKLRKNVGLNLMLIQNNENSEQSYYFQLLEKKETGKTKGVKKCQYFLKFFISEPKQNIKFRVIEDYNRMHQHPLVRGLKDSGLQEVNQIHPYFGNVFIDSDKYLLKDDQAKKLNDKTKDLYKLMYNKKSCLNFFDTTPLKNSMMIRTYYDSKRAVQVRMQKFDKYHNGQKQFALEIWNTNMIPIKVQNPGFCAGHHIEYKHGEVLHTEIVQSTFFDTNTLKEFSNFCPSSVVEKVVKNDDNDGFFKQRYQVLTLQDIEHEDADDDKDMIYRIYEYELTWNELKPEKSTTKFRLVGRKQIVFNDEKIDRFCIIAPFYKDNNNYIINGTQLLNAHGENSIILDNFNAIDYQFKTGICNTGYKIYQDTKDDTDWKCILIETQVNTCALPAGHDGDAVTPEQREKARQALTNLDLMRMYEYQFNVVFNMVPFDPLQTIGFLDETLDSEKHDHFCPLEILNGNSIVDFTIFHPQSVQESSEQSDCFPSIIDQFLANQNEVRPFPGDEKKVIEDRHFYGILDQSFGKKQNWYRNVNEVWQDLVQTNPLYRCYDQEDHNIAITAISGALITQKILEQQMTMYTYEMVLQVLPIVITTKSIDIEQYANFFIDAENAINFGINMKDEIDFDGKVKVLPKFAYLPYQITKIFAKGKVNELDMRIFATKHMIELDEEDYEFHKEIEELEIRKAEDKAKGYSTKLSLNDSAHTESKNKIRVLRECSDSDDDLKQDDCGETENTIVVDMPHKHRHNVHQHDTPKDVKVKYFLIDFDSMAYLSKMRYIQGVSDEKIEVTERVMAEYFVDINEKFFDYFDQAPILRNLLDINFVDTKKFFNLQMLILVLGFIVPFLVQLFFFGEDPWVIRGLVICCQVTQIFFTAIMLTLMSKEYLSDINNVNQLILSIFFPVYTFFRFANTSNMLPTNDGEMTGIYGFFLFSNCYIIMAATFKLFQLMKSDPKFGLLVQLVTVALVDCIYFTVFMMIWIIVFAMIFRIFGADSGQNSDNFPNIDGATAAFLQTFENSIGNINNPSYSLWIDKYNCNVQDHNDVFLCTTSNKVISIVSIYVIWAVWFINQMVVFIILVNYLIVYIGNSYQNVMDSALKFKYSAIVQNSREYAIIRQKFLGSRLVVPFVLVANVNEEGDDASFGGLVSQITDFARASSRALKKEIDCQTKEMENHIKKKYSHFNNKVAENQTEIMKDIKETSEKWDAGIQTVKKDTERVKEFLEDSIVVQKEEMEDEFKIMWDDMFRQFGDLKQAMVDDMNTVKKEFGDVNSDVNAFNSTFKEGLNNAQTNMNDQLASVTSNVGAMNNNVSNVNQSVKDVGAGVKEAEASALAGINEVNSTVGGVGDALNSVKAGVMANVDGVQAGIDKVKDNTNALATNVSKTNENVNNAAAEGAAKAQRAEQEAQEMAVRDQQRNEELERKAQQTKSKKDKAKKGKEEKKKGGK